MSYASGFMMGTAIIQGLARFLGGTSGQGAGNDPVKMFGQNMKKGLFQEAENLPLPNFSRPSAVPGQQLKLVSSLPGRRRYRLTGMTAAQARLLENAFSRLSYIKEAKANEISGSILIIYDSVQDARLDDLIKAMESKIFSRTGTSCAPPAVEAPAGIITRSILGAMRDFSMWVNRSTNGMFDASSLASVLLFFQGLRKLLETQQFPSASQMLWWAVSLMRGWRTL